MTLTPDQLHILQHSLGCDQYGRGTLGRDERDGTHGYSRNRYVSDPTPDLDALVAAGLMQDRGAVAVYGEMHGYVVTRLGVDTMLKQSPKPPKLTRSQKRYQEYLDADCGMTFGEWLKSYGSYSAACASADSYRYEQAQCAREAGFGQGGATYEHD
jgi:hypothetical protein